MNQRQPILAIGELWWDRRPDARRPGGAPFEWVSRLCELGWPAHLASSVGDDEDGRLLVAELQRHGFDVSLVQRDPDHATGTLATSVSADGETRRRIASNVAYDYVRPDANLIDAAAHAAALCFGTLAQRKETTRTTIERCIELAGDATLVYDLNLCQSYYTPDLVRRSLALADVVCLEDREVLLVGTLLELSARTPRDFARLLVERFEVDTVFITHGASGCLIVRGDEVVEKIEAPGAAAKGRDDLSHADREFMAAFVAALLEGETLERCAHLADSRAARR